IMTDHVSKSQFKARALEFFRQVETTGEPIVITDHGQPRLELRRYSAPQRNSLETLRGTVLRYDAPMEPVGDEDREAES
ncbi:type II toxin-antitoxin system Phd/YefM family antitoxin, partial [Rhizobiaceae sp. 2RAB30]